MAGNYSLEAPGIFSLGPPDGELWVVRQVIWFMQVVDGPLISNEYGDQTALTNGILVKYFRGGEDQDVLDRVPIKDNGNLSRHFGQAVTPNILVPAEAAIALVHGFFTFGDIPLLGDTDDRFEVHIRDDLSGLESHSIKLSGYVAIG
jgi:hypothetical protein